MRSTTLLVCLCSDCDLPGEERSTVASRQCWRSFGLCSTFWISDWGSGSLRLQLESHSTQLLWRDFFHFKHAFVARQLHSLECWV